MRLLAPVAVLLLSTACWGWRDGPGTVVITEPPPDGWTDTGWDPPEPDPNAYVYFWVAGDFAYDPVTDRARSYLAADGGTGTIVQPSITVTLATEMYLDTFDDYWTCSITLTTAEPLEHASWADGTDAGFGFVFPEDAPVAATTCPPAWSLGVQRHRWGMGIGILDIVSASDLQEAVEGNPDLDWETEWAPHVFGGGIYLDALVGQSGMESGYVALEYGFGIELDVEFREPITEDGETPLVTNEGLPRGAYRLDPLYLMAGAELFE